MNSKVKFSDKRSKTISIPKIESPVSRHWQEFALKKRIVYWLLILLTLYVALALAALALGLTGKVKITGMIAALLIGGTLGALGRLLGNAFKSIFRS